MFINRKMTMIALTLGLLSAPAFAEMSQTEEMATPMYNFSDYDVNNDSMISENEFATSLEEELANLNFKDFDINADGALNETEFSELARAAISRGEMESDINFK